MIKGERLVLGSVYINVSKIDEIDVLEQVLTKILGSHQKVIVCMDANARSLQWDPSCINRERSSMSRKMGFKLEKISLDLSLSIMNNGEITYRSGNTSSAVDVTLSHGIEQLGETKWYLIEDMLQTPHKGIIIEIGKKPKFEKVKVIDWKSFDWSQYKKESEIFLTNLYRKWSMNDKKADVEGMATELQNGLQGCKLNSKD